MAVFARLHLKGENNGCLDARHSGYTTEDTAIGPILCYPGGIGMSDDQPLTVPTQPVQFPVAIGPYTILSELGRGGMGTVYLAQDPSLDRKVVVKVLHSFLANDPIFIQRFVQEANSAAAVNHPAVIRIFKIEVQSTPPYIVMEYFNGESLSERIKRDGSLDNTFGLMVARNVTLGLREAWRRGLVHRDIKPSNILVDSEGFVKLVDFGIAKSIERDLHLTQTGEIIGTPYYMAPETLKGGKSDFRSDMYSLGVTLFSAFVGRYPYDVHSAAELAVFLHAQKQPDPALLRPDLPPSTAELIRRLMAIDPGARYPDYDTLVMAIDKAMTMPSTASRTRPRFHLLFLYAALFAIAGIALLGYVLHRPPPSSIKTGASPASASAASALMPSTHAPVAPVVTTSPSSVESETEKQESVVQPRKQALSPPPQRSEPTAPSPPPPPPAAPSLPSMKELVYDFSAADARDGWSISLVRGNFSNFILRQFASDRGWTWADGRLTSDPNSRMVLKKLVRGDLMIKVDAEFSDDRDGVLTIIAYAWGARERGYIFGLRRNEVGISKILPGSQLPLVKHVIERPSGRFKMLCTVDKETLRIECNGILLCEVKDIDYREGVLALRVPEGKAFIYRVEIRSNEFEDFPKPTARDRTSGFSPPHRALVRSTGRG